MVRIFTKIIDWFRYISVIPFLALVVVTSVDVIERYAIKKGVPDALEIVCLLLAASVSLSLPRVTYMREQVSFSMVIDRLPSPIRRVANVFQLFVGSVVFSLMSWQAINRTIYSFQKGEFVGAMETPYWPVKLLFAIGCLFTAVGLIISFVIGLGNHQDINPGNGLP